MRLPALVVQTAPSSTVYGIGASFNGARWSCWPLIFGVAMCLPSLVVHVAPPAVYRWLIAFFYGTDRTFVSWDSKYRERIATFSPAGVMRRAPATGLRRIGAPVNATTINLDAALSTSKRIPVPQPTAVVFAAVAVTCNVPIATID